ncbi:MAG TPA: lysine transporter LysE [Clostridiales bacterium]|nr:lysine transporter LysE [Clostridiales bacterium]
MKVIVNGIRFGILLQMAIGPMCLMTFNTAMSQGFARGMVVVAAIAVVDILYMTLAGLGVAQLMKNSRIQRGIRFFGSIVLILFGLNILLGALGYSLLPGISLFGESQSSSLFLRCAFLTASNPLTIVFFSGIFSSQVAENQYQARELIVFGVGVMLATGIFLTGVAALGTMLSGFIPDTAVSVMNGAVGLFLIYFGLKMYRKKGEDG